MCDQDHFDDDRKEYEFRGLVTRRQFGVLLGAGVAMLLPQVLDGDRVEDTIAWPLFPLPGAYRGGWSGRW